jgi:hypothetical protein
MGHDAPRPSPRCHLPAVDRLLAGGAGPGRGAAVRHIWNDAQRASFPCQPFSVTAARRASVSPNPVGYADGNLAAEGASNPSSSSEREAISCWAAA